MAIFPYFLWIHLFMSVPLCDISAQKINTVIKGEESLLPACSLEHSCNLLTFIMYTYYVSEIVLNPGLMKKGIPLFSNSLHSLLKEMTS